MKSPKPLRHCRGSVLISAAIAASILAIVIATILTYIGNEYYLNLRSQRWSQSLHLAEAAVEVGFAEFNYYYQTGSGFQSSRGWTSSFGTYTKTVSNFTDSANNIVGNIQVTVLGAGTGTPWILGVGTCPTLPRGPTVSRGVKAILAGSTSYPMQLISTAPLVFPGAIVVDSYDSSNPTKSTNGAYDITKRQANGNIGTTSGDQITTGKKGAQTVVPAFNLNGSGAIYGTIATGPSGSGTMTGGSSVGPVFTGRVVAPNLAQAEANGWVRHDFAVTIPDVTVPSGLASAANVGTISLAHSDAQTINGGDYQVNALSVVGNSCLTISGNVRLYVQGNVTTANSGSINITPGSSLAVYIGGTTFSISGAGIVNNAVRPQNNQWFGLPAVNTGTLANSGQFQGTMYFPEAQLNVTGNADLMGSFAAANLNITGSSKIHYDESLSSINGGGSYILNSWQEMRQSGGTWVIW